MSSNQVFHVVDAADVDPERDVYIGLPVETVNKQTFYRLPIRSANVGGGNERRVQMLPGSSVVVQSTQGLRRLLLRFPMSYCPRITTHVGDGDNDRTNHSIGFALYDHRAGPTPDDNRLLQSIDRLGTFIAQTMVRCERIRTTLKIGPANMPPAQQQVVVDYMNLCVARPASDDKHCRYCYSKIVSPDSNAPEIFHTYFWTPRGERIPLEVVEGYRNFQVVPYVEIEEVFVSKAVRSLQLKLRECIVYPPIERAMVRSSVCFPDKMCSHKDAETPPPMNANNNNAPTIDNDNIVAACEEETSPVTILSTLATTSTEELMANAGAPPAPTTNDEDRPRTTRGGNRKRTAHQAAAVVVDETATVPVPAVPLEDEEE